MHIAVMVTDRIMEKNKGLIDMSSPVSVFSIIRVFPVRVQKFPDVI